MRLEQFAFSFQWRNYHGIRNAAWTLPKMFLALNHQRKNIRRIEIAPLYSGNAGLEGVDLSGYEALEELSLPSTNMTTTNGVDEILSAPKLRKFVWCFIDASPRGGVSMTLDQFQEEQETWLRRLLTTAAERKHALRQVKIDWEPRNDVKSKSSAKQWVYPWDRLERLRDEGREVGIEVMYFPPTFTREMFESVWIERDKKDGEGS